MLAVGTLAVGIGLSAALLAVLNGTVWHPLSFPSADQLVAIQGPVTAETVAGWSAARSFDGLAGYKSRRYTLTGAGDAASLRATVSTGPLFAILDARAAAGRVLGMVDDRPGSMAVVVSDRCWHSTFAADPALSGRTIYLNGTAFLVAGIVPPGFQFPVNAEPPDVYTTLAADLRTDRRPSPGSRPSDLSVVARLKPGATLAEARTEMARFIGIARTSGKARQRRGPFEVVPLAEDLASGLVSPLTALAWAVAGVAAIACATASVLSLIRVTSRRAEWTTRSALGATPGDLARQMVAESVIVALAGGVIGSLLAAAVCRPVLLVAGPAVNAAARARFDARVFAWVGLASLAEAACFGVVPAIHVALTRWVGSGTSGSTSRAPAAMARAVMVTVEIAVVVTLLSGCISLLRAYATLVRIDTGFRPAGVTTFRIDLPESAYPPARQAAFFERLRAESAAVPDVAAAAFNLLPPFGDFRFTIALDAPGRAPGEWESGGAEVNLVSPDYFRTMGIPLVEGREFASSDDRGREPVIIVSRAAAARQFPGEDPIGRTLDVRIGPNAGGPLPRVVGVVRDVRNGSLTARREPQVYVPYSQAPMMASTTFVVRVTGGDRGAAIAAIRQRLRTLDPSIPMVSVRPLDEFLQTATSVPRFTTLLVGVFAAAAAFLGIAGLYAVVLVRRAVPPARVLDPAGPRRDRSRYRRARDPPGADNAHPRAGGGTGGGICGGEAVRESAVRGAPEPGADGRGGARRHLLSVASGHVAHGPFGGPRRSPREIAVGRVRGAPVGPAQTRSIRAGAALRLCSRIGQRRQTRRDDAPHHLRRHQDVPVEMHVVVQRERLQRRQRADREREPSRDPQAHQHGRRQQEQAQRDQRRVGPPVEAGRPERVEDSEADGVHPVGRETKRGDGEHASIMRPGDPTIEGWRMRGRRPRPGERLVPGPCAADGEWSEI